MDGGSKYHMAFACIGLAMSVWGCDTATRQPPQRTVAVSVPPLAYFVERLAGDDIHIEVMVPPGASPATHEPTIAELRAMETAGVYVKVGHPRFPFEKAWLGRLLAKADDVRVVDCSKGVEVRTGDPHLWLSPPVVRDQLVPRIAQGLAEWLPDRRDAIERRREGLRAEIDALDSESRAALSGLARRRFYVFHAAWGYFADAYGLQQVAIETGGKEPDPHTLARILDEAGQEGVGMVLVQPQFSRSAAELVASEIGARVVAVDPLARDWPRGMRRITAVLEKALKP